MQIVTDRGCDISTAQLEGLNIHLTPMRLTLDGKTYSSGVDITSEQFYSMLDQTEGFPTTSQASAGDFADLYRELAETDPEILSIHISSGLSGTLDSARLALEMVPEAKVTLWDTRTLSAPQAWQVEAAARAIKAGWSLDKVLSLMERIRDATEGIFTLDTLKYLIHGGRISHLKGLLASLLHIRPVIAVDRSVGKYVTLGQERTMGRALQKIVQSLEKIYPDKPKMRVQMLHAYNPEAVEKLHEIVEGTFDCEWLPTVTVGPILGAHTGKTLVGLCAAPTKIFADVP
jgi:DegV family protein with EDD domain